MSKPKSLNRQVHLILNPLNLFLGFRILNNQVVCAAVVEVPILQGQVELWRRLGL